MDPNVCWKYPENCNNGLSFCFWVKIIGNPLVYQAHVVASFQDEYAGFAGFIFKYLDGEMLVKVYTGLEEYRIYTTPPVYNTWTHYCSVFKKGAYLHLYENGQYFLGNAVYGETRSSGSPDIYFGGISGYKGHFVLDEFAVWEEELSSAEMNVIYNSY